MPRFARSIVAASCSFLAVSVMHAERGGADWMTVGNDVQRSYWLRFDGKISEQTLRKPGFEMVWKMKLKNTARQQQALTPPALALRSRPRGRSPGPTPGGRGANRPRPVRGRRRRGRGRELRQGEVCVSLPGPRHRDDHDQQHHLHTEAALGTGGERCHGLANNRP